jgi:tetratricopeptide (TPR) repeat protein
MLGGKILMKTIFRASALGLLTAVAAVSGFAQNPCEDSYETKQAIYQKFRDNRKAPVTVEKAKAGIQAGEEFISKYGTCEADKQVVDFIKGKLPEMKTFVGEQERFTRFNDSIKDPKNVNVANAFTSGKEIIAASPDTALDVALVLASIGYDNVAVKNPAVNTYNNDAITFAKTAIQQLESGKTSQGYGAYAFSYVIKDAAGKTDAQKSKENALAWMNYSIGFIMYYNQNQKKDALPYFYKAAQFNSPVKDRPVIYQAIGAWYLDEILAMDEKRKAIVKTNADQENDESKKIWALQKGYADRAIDAYARAYKLASANPKTEAAYKTALYEKLQGLYKLRFEKTDGIDAYVASVMNKPMPNPATEVTPVAEETPATTTSSTTTPTTTTTTPSTKPATTNTTTTKPATTTTTTTKPSASTPTKTATTNGKTSSNANTTTKPATTKKKGNR